MKPPGQQQVFLNPANQLRLVVEIPFFTCGFKHHPNGGWPWDFERTINSTVDLLQVDVLNLEVFSLAKLAFEDLM